MSHARAEEDPYRAGFIVRKGWHPDNAATARDLGARICPHSSGRVVPEGGVGDGAAAACFRFEFADPGLIFEAVVVSDRCGGESEEGEQGS